jgi:hypothetical protein
MSLIFATQLTAVATTVLAAFAIVTAWYARKAFREQSEEVRTLKVQLKDQQDFNAKQVPVLELQAKELQQSLDERERDRAQRRRAQAARVLFWEDRAHEHVSAERGFSASIIANAVNTSDLPVYGLEIHWHKGTAPWDAPDYEPDLMPGATKEFRRALPSDLPDSVDRSLFGAVLRFRDAAGVRWQRRPDGHLDEIPVAQADGQ